jgi:hypothetical protein
VNLWQGAARRVRGTWAQANAAYQLDALARRELNALVEVA